MFVPKEFTNLITIALILVLIQHGQIMIQKLVILVILVVQVVLELQVNVHFHALQDWCGYKAHALQLVLMDFLLMDIMI